MSFIVVVRRLRVRILTSAFFLNKILKFFCCMHRRFSRFHFFFFVYEPRFCVFVCGRCSLQKYSVIVGSCALAKIKAPFDFTIFFPNVVHLSLLSIFRHGGVFSICKSQSHKPRNDLKSSIVFIRYSF